MAHTEIGGREITDFEMEAWADMEQAEAEFFAAEEAARKAQDEDMARYDADMKAQMAFQDACIASGCILFENYQEKHLAAAEAAYERSDQYLLPRGAR